MAETDIGQAIASDLTTAMTDFSVDSRATDGITDGESRWSNTKWTQYNGYYNEIPELASAIDCRKTWTIGKGFETDPENTEILDNIRGVGNESFNTILGNLIRTMLINGDSYAEIIKDENGIIINIKPLEPSSITIVYKKNGMIKHYEQTAKTSKAVKILKKEKVFHLTRNRIADEIHGTSVITKVEKIILARNEAMEDYKQVMHWFVKPRWIFHLDTDNPAKIAAFKAKYDKANALGENMYIPKGAVVPELQAVSANATLNPQAWIEALNDYFYEAVGVPKVIVGNSKNFTEASSNTVYLAFQQSVEDDQLYIEEQVGMQLGIIINLTFPASMENSALSNKDKETRAEKAVSGPTEGATTAGVSK